MTIKLKVLSLSLSPPPITIAGTWKFNLACKSAKNSQLWEPSRNIPPKNKPYLAVLMELSSKDEITIMAYYIQEHTVGQNN